MVELQLRQRPRSRIQEIIGILSYHAIWCLQCGQLDGGKIILSLRTRRYATTFKNEPQQISGGKEAKIIISLPFQNLSQLHLSYHYQILHI